jgi:hypothetical protein
MFVFQVEAGVKGAVCTTTRKFEHRPEAEAYAARVRSSNSIGSYWAVLTQIPCECPDDARGPWDCCECQLHGEAMQAECAAEQQAECDAENAWLRAAENHDYNCPDWAM